MTCSASTSRRRATPSLRSTVAPAYFATLSRAPVSRLNSAVLPQLGFPTSVMRGRACNAGLTPAPGSARHRVRSGHNGLDQTQREHRFADAHCQRFAPARTLLNDFHGSAGQKAELRQSIDDGPSMRSRHRPETDACAPGRSSASEIGVLVTLRGRATDRIGAQMRMVRTHCASSVRGGSIPRAAQLAGRSRRTDVA